jgi:formylglycine-generating enzyme required for sulfatase activity
LSPERERALSPKDTFKECANCPQMIVVPAGSFTMGSPASEPGRSSNEGPQRIVTIARQYAVGQFELTFDQWDACVADGGCNSYKPPDQGWGRGHRPVINVSWDDAKAYVAWLAKKTDKFLVSAAHRGRIRICGARWDDDGLSVGQRRRQECQLRRLRHPMG